MLEYDGIQSTEDSPVIIKEHVFTILDDLSHDGYAVQHIRNLIHNFLIDEVHYQVDLLHEFTMDGCSAQYKSRHCMGSHVLLSNKDFGVVTQRNYFETLHTKGEQDAAGAHIKQRAAMAVVQNEATTQSGHDLYSLLSSNLTRSVGGEQN